VDQYITDLRRITGETNDESAIIDQVGPLAQRMAQNMEWFDGKYYEIDDAQGYGVHLLHEEPDHSLFVIVVAWRPGGCTPPHDHGTWAVVVGLEGEERNILYRRVDDGSRPDKADLEVKADDVAGPSDLVCMNTGGIHLVRNETDSISVSLHTYGRNFNHTDRSQFDLETGERKDFKVAVN